MSAHRRGVERVDRPVAQFVHPFRYVEGSEEHKRAARWQLGAARSRDVTPVAAAPEIALDYEESLHPDLRFHTHVSDLMTTVEEVLRPVGWLERVAAARSAAVERTIP